MQEHGARTRIRAASILGGCLLAGLAAAGYFVGRGTARFKADTRTVTVKGLVEREVAADEAVWTLSLRQASDDPKEAQGRIGRDRDAVVTFLKARGFTDADISRMPTRAVDKQAREFDQPPGASRFRYLVTSAVVVRTANVDLVQQALGATEELLNAGVLLDGETGGAANPRFVVAKFNQLRPELLAEATRNARLIAQQFAANSGATVGRIQSANQGMIQIFGSDGNDESGPFSPTSTPVKKIRVVSTIEFALN